MEILESMQQNDIALPAMDEVLATYIEPEVADEMSNPIFMSHSATHCDK